MINQKYYNDIKQFPSQFAKAFAMAKDIKVEGSFSKVMVCGMGGSSLYTGLLNDLLAEDASIKLRVDVCKGYNLPANAGADTLYIVASYSGNTEETLSCLEEIVAKKFSYCVFASGGKLADQARANQAPLYTLPGGVQPRLSTGYFMAGLLKIMTNCGLIPEMETKLLAIAEKIDASLDEERAKTMAKAIKGKVPIIYATDNNSSIAHVCKIKFNENSKTQAFWNFFPELNHNEMVGFSNLVMDPFFIVFSSQYTHPRNHKRMSVFKDLLSKKDVTVDIVEMTGDSVFAEMMNAYYFIDHVTYYLSEEYGIDPEPVDMVEEFKLLINK